MCIEKITAYILLAGRNIEWNVLRQCLTRNCQLVLLEGILFVYFSLNIFIHLRNIQQYNTDIKLPIVGFGNKLITAYIKY